MPAPRLLWLVNCILVGLGSLSFPGQVYLVSAGEIQHPSTPPDARVYGIELTPEQRQHWAYLPLRDQDLVVDSTSPSWRTSWGNGAIDTFILNRMKSAGVSPSLRADHRVWLRRIYFDLIGLPPPPAVVDAFLDDPSPDARLRIVDRLLADPGYGVRWGRKWLDVVRYGDTNGYERDGDKPSVWRYRDYVINSLNSDKPFDRFLLEQIAGDEAEFPDSETMTATSFLRLGTWDDEPADPLVDRYDQLDDVVRGVSTAFFGVTLTCARCHNHKFEPFSQIDYARMVAVFAPLERPQEGRTEFDRVVGTPAEVSAFEVAKVRSDAVIKQLREQIKTLDDAVQNRLLMDAHSQIPADLRTALSAPESSRSDVQKKLVKSSQKLIKDRIEAALTLDERRQREGFQKALSVVLDSQPAALAKAYIFNEKAGDLSAIQVFRRGDPTTPAGCVEPGVPAVMATSADLKIIPPALSKSTGRRLALARWMIDTRQNGLVSRVIVNRIWQGHFGEGLVRTENDFGVMGASPSHPELLEWLATDLVQNGWSLKRLHRMIVLSETYAQSSASRDDAHKLDESNVLLWKFPYRRLDAEAIRDAILECNGTLNPQLGGPGVYPKLGADVLASQSRPGNGWGQSSPMDAARRSAYIFVKRSLLVPFMELLDLPDTTASCEQRNISTIPTQSLTLINSPFMNEQAQQFALRLQRDAGEDLAAQIRLGYRLALARLPDADELEQGIQFLLKRQQENPSTALAALCLVLYNLNEFVYLD